MSAEHNATSHEIPDWVEEVSPHLITLQLPPLAPKILCRDSIAQGLKAAAKSRHQKGEWWIWSFSVLPDSVLALISFSADTTTQMSIANWKRFTQRTTKTNWKPGFKEKPIDDQEALDTAAAFIKASPAENGLCEPDEAWPQYWVSDDFA